MSAEREPGDRAFWDSHEESLEKPLEEESAPATVEEPAPGRRVRRRPEEAILEWARAIALGIRDTAQDVLDEGRAGASRKQAEMWEKFDSKTKGRRTRP